jgi:hypothetical protein
MLPLVFVTRSAAGDVRQVNESVLSAVARVSYLEGVSPTHAVQTLQSISAVLTSFASRESGEIPAAAPPEVRFVQCLVAGQDRFPLPPCMNAWLEFNQNAAAGQVASIPSSSVSDGPASMCLADEL